MYDYDEISELKSDLELSSIDLEGAIERIAISLEAHSDLLENEDLSEDSQSMMKHFADASDLLSTIIGHLNAVSSEKDSQEKKSMNTLDVEILSYSSLEPEYDDDVRLATGK